MKLDFTDYLKLCHTKKVSKTEKNTDVRVRTVNNDCRRTNWYFDPVILFYVGHVLFLSVYSINKMFLKIYKPNLQGKGRPRYTSQPD